jgi:hypothetical protein
MHACVRACMNDDGSAMNEYMHRGATAAALPWPPTSPTAASSVAATASPTASRLPHRLLHRRRPRHRIWLPLLLQPFHRLLCRHLGLLTTSYRRLKRRMRLGWAGPAGKYIPMREAWYSLLTDEFLDRGGSKLISFFNK